MSPLCPCFATQRAVLSSADSRAMHAMHAAPYFISPRALVKTNCARVIVRQAREAEGAAVDARPQPSEQDPDIIEQETLRKYIAYAKQNCHPKLQNADYDKIAQVPFPPSHTAQNHLQGPSWASVRLQMTVCDLPRLMQPGFTVCAHAGPCVEPFVAAPRAGLETGNMKKKIWK